MPGKGVTLMIGNLYITYKYRVGSRRKHCLLSIVHLFNKIKILSTCIYLMTSVFTALFNKLAVLSYSSQDTMVQKAIPVEIFNAGFLFVLCRIGCGCSICLCSGWGNDNISCCVDRFSVLVSASLWDVLGDFLMQCLCQV